MNNKLAQLDSSDDSDSGIASVTSTVSLGYTNTDGLLMAGAELIKEPLISFL